MSGSLDRMMSLALTAAAVLFAGVLVRREVVGGKAPPGADAELRKVQRVANWDAIRTTGVPIRAPNARVMIVEFADLECPACSAFHTRLQQVSADLEIETGLTLVHYPLSIHRFAQSAARALECADVQGAAARFLDLAYAKQDSFGLKPWTRFAAEAGVRYTTAFAGCASASSPVPRIEKGRRMAESMGLRGTPTLVVNGWLLPSVPTNDELRALITALNAGGTPPGA